MKKTICIAAAVAAFMSASAAQACSDINEVMARVETITGQFSENASRMGPADLELWQNQIQVYSDAMGKMDLVAACGALDTIAVKLNLGGAAAAATAPAATTATESATTATAQPQPQPQATQDTQAAAAPASGDVWQECPRGRCRNR